jgi:hypothetical protein
MLLPLSSHPLAVPSGSSSCCRLLPSARHNWQFFLPGVTDQSDRNCLHPLEHGGRGDGGRCVCLWSVCVALCVGSGLAMGCVRFEVFTAVTMKMEPSGMLRPVALVRTNVSEELSASFIRVTRIGELPLVFLRSVRRLLVKLVLFLVHRVLSP